MQSVAALRRDEIETLLCDLLARTGTSLDAALLLSKQQQQQQALGSDAIAEGCDDTPAWLVDATRQLHQLQAEEEVRPHEQPTGGQPMQLCLAKPAPQCRLGLRLQHFEGVVVVLAVTPSSPAAAAGLQPGDRLLDVAGTEVTSGDQVAALLSDAVGSVPLLVLRPERPDGAETAPAPAAEADSAARAAQQKLEEWAREQRPSLAQRAAEEDAALCRARAVWAALDASAREELSARAEALAQQPEEAAARKTRRTSF